MSTTMIFRDPEGREYKFYSLPVTRAVLGMFWLGQLLNQVEHVTIVKVGAGTSSGKPILLAQRDENRMDHVHFDQVTGRSVSPSGYMIMPDELKPLQAALNRPPPAHGHMEGYDLRSTF